MRTLRTKPILATIAERGKRLMDGIRDIFVENGIPVIMSGFPAMFSFALNCKPFTNHREWDKSDQQLYLRLANAAMARGVMPDDDAREPWFMSYAHTDELVDETLNVLAEVVRKHRKRQL